MAVITTVPEPNLWNEICKEVAAMRPPFRDDDSASVATVLEDYDAAKHTPVFYGNVMHKRVSVDQSPETDFDAAVSHPACVGFAFVPRPPPEKEAESPPPIPDSRTCTPREYLEHYVFPLLLPALEQLLDEAKLYRCFERKYTAFNAADFLTEYLYKHNSRHSDRENVTLADIPFVQEWWKDHPRPPLPKSVLWSEEEACVVIQAFWQGYKVRAEPQVQELRQWQHDWREELRAKTFDFVGDRRPSEDDDKPSTPPPETQDITGVDDSTGEVPQAEDTEVKTDEENIPRADDTTAPTENALPELPCCS